MMEGRRGATEVEYPSELEIRVRRRFDAPAALVFDVFTKPEHVREHFAPYDETMTVCSIDLKVGGHYHYAFRTPDGVECTFRGTFLEVQPPTRTVQTWLFEGWPDAEAVETMELHENDGATMLTWTLAFRDAAGRAHMSTVDGVQASFDNVEAYLGALAERGGPTG